MAVALSTLSHYLPAKPFFTFGNPVIRYTVGIRVENDLSRFSAIRLQLTPSVCDGRFVRKCSSITATKVSKGDVPTVLTKWRETAMLVIDMQMEGKLKKRKVPQWVRNPSLKKIRTSKTSSGPFVARKISSQISQNDVAEEEAVQRTQKVEMAAQRAIRLHAHAQALMEQADMATYRAVMAARIFDARSNASTSQAAPNSKPDHDVIPFTSID